RGEHRRTVENLRALGFVRIAADGVALDISEPGAEEPAGLGVDLAAAGEVFVIVDRIVVTPDVRQRLSDALGTAFVEGDGEAVVWTVGRDGGRRAGASGVAAHDGGGGSGAAPGTGAKARPPSGDGTSIGVGGAPDTLGEAETRGGDGVGFGNRDGHGPDPA